jgi:hypothetical protein
MTATEDLSKRKPAPSAEQRAALELVRLVKEGGLWLTGPDSLLKQPMKSVIETALSEEDDRASLGYEEHDRAGAEQKSRR